MAKAEIFLYIILVSILAASFFRPYIGAIAYYLMSIWVPHPIWPYVFAQVPRLTLIIAAGTLLGFGRAALTGRIDFTKLKSRQNIYLFILLLFVILSYVFPPYDVDTGKIVGYITPETLIDNMLKIILFYYVLILVVDELHKLKYLSLIMVFTGVFYVYWGNNEYLSGNLMLYGNTLVGPGLRDYEMGTVYTDENCFAMLFVTVIPFLYFMGVYYKKKLIKYFLWLNIPFAWHCIFLTGSRGGLVGLGTVTMFMALRSKKKLFIAAIPIAMIAAFIWQGGDYTKSRADSALNLEKDSSAQQRFQSWTAGLKMTIAHPLTGVGIGNFLVAYRDFAKTERFVAHNTLIQFSSECGMIAGLMYLLLCYGVFKDFLKQIKMEQNNLDPLLIAVNESVTGSMIGFFVCAVFLNLATYEIFYFFLALNAIKSHLLKKSNESQTQNPLPEFS
ncbi:MAG: hypothetical protein GX654_06610 [Desulfatiglans sp.]|nr:hypothetical protein [Desulfatiglans sp.]